VRILFVGDVFGSPGRSVVCDHLADIIARNAIDLTIVNAENAAGGFGLTGPLAEELFDAGADVLTTGNHVWDRREIHDYLRQADGTNRPSRVLRPANLPGAHSGSGLYLGKASSGDRYAVIGLQGRVFMTAIDCPFRKADELLRSLPADCRTIIVDFHAEASSEKQALGIYLDGRVSAVIGTHTHVPTADERILPKGTAFQTDVGMTGPYEGVIGCRAEDVLERFLKATPSRLEPARGDVRLCGLMVETAEGRAISVERLQLRKTD
jgi:metallophosphoesterase (TIGR00282 family)